MYDSVNEYNSKDRKVVARFIYKVADIFLTRNGVPFFGSISKRIRCFLARRISKGIKKGAVIEKGAVIFPGVCCEPHGCIGIKCVTCWGLHIGEHAMMGPNCVFLNQSHKRAASGDKVFVGIEPPKPIYIGRHAWLGYNVVVLGGVNIGEGSTIGASAVVTHNVPDFSLAAGNPAVIKKEYHRPSV